MSMSIYLTGVLFHKDKMHYLILIFKEKIILFLKYVMIYQLEAIEYLFVFLQLDMFRAYTRIFRSNGCYYFFTYAAYVKKM